MAPVVVSAAFSFTLLFLPLKSCLPLAQLLPGNDLGCQQKWPSPLDWKDLPGGPLLSSEEGSFQDTRAGRTCQPPGDQAQRQRAKRSMFSSKRRDGRPNSLDLTFHLLREYLEMTREERLAQKARSNKILLHNIGK